MTYVSRVSDPICCVSDQETGSFNLSKLWDDRKLNHFFQKSTTNHGHAIPRISCMTHPPMALQRRRWLAEHLKQSPCCALVRTSSANVPVACHVDAKPVN